MRFGLVPIVHSDDSTSQAKVAHHLHETYGLSTLLKYFEEVRIFYYSRNCHMFCHGHC